MSSNPLPNLSVLNQDNSSLFEQAAAATLADGLRLPETLAQHPAFSRVFQAGKLTFGLIAPFKGYADSPFPELHDFAELAPLFKLRRQDLPATAKARDQLRAENDKIVARLYGITDAELAHLLRSFKGLATKRPEYLALLQ